MKAWQAALADANRANLDRFFRDRPEWKARLDGDDIASTRAALLAELSSFSRKHAEKHERILALGRGLRDARELCYRMQVREAALLRTQTRLLTIAGEAYLSARASPAEREDYEREPAGGPVPDRSPFPPAVDDWTLLETVRTPRIGIDHEPADSGAFSEGAALVRSVAPDSPAERAGLRVGDVILGPRESRSRSETSSGDG